MAEDLGVDRSTIYRQLRRLEAAGAIVRDRRRVGGRLMTGWTLAGASDPLRAAESIGAAVPDAPGERVAAVRVLRHVGLERLRRLLAPLPRPDRAAVRWWTRDGWRAARLAGAPPEPRATVTASMLADRLLARPWWPRAEAPPC
ncbi:HTH domain-containing protein [Nannocystis sp. bb15-2]|uniref:HTH domain-containing protein n=2 Tax=Nannocystis bainbridge TaxID=2995303 RepID=A0ABT5E248_9BACT|nr:HTH domain-containing protein [Nannocystis bainbridge]MDC0719950.1 HTH domain-containing protein [Nannocystis bainbridge]